MKNIERIENKIFSYEELKRQIAVWRFQNKKIVFTNGCFDIVHLGHVVYLSKAKDLGDILIVGLNSDNSIRRIKKPGRPITEEKSRSMMLASMLFVDAVVIFDEDTPYELIKLVQPDILVKGSDYKPEYIVGYDIVKNRGGEVHTIDFIEGYSTTVIEEKIKNSDIR
jgi:rfaE bifunctional protein nucleotidyltransferase chain/domain